MSMEQHAENRAWAFRALSELKEMLNDPDFEGDREEEAAVIDRKYKELADGKYRVVFLGAFNVGKSTLINAFLGQEYLPSVLEECTIKITHVVRGEQMLASLRLVETPDEDELDALRRLLEAMSIEAEVYLNEDASEIVIEYAESHPLHLSNTLKALVTMNADEEFPQLKTLRGKFTEIYAQAPNERLEEDIALVDSPGVYSISQTNRKVAQDIIPNSHLVVCMLDSQNAGNEQNRDFIEGIVKERHRKVFFVINKADQLNADEVDPSGRRGPARDLRRSLEGIVEEPEIFFLSSLYALLGLELEQGIIEQEAIEENNKVKIPMSRQREMLEAPDTKQAMAQYLIEQSYLDTFRNRLREYLYTENREGAIVSSVCRFVDDLTWRYARPLEIKLEMAKHVPRLEVLTRERKQEEALLEDHRRHEEEVVKEFDAMANGGDVAGRHYEGYDAIADNRLDKKAADAEVVKPLHNWIDKSDNLKRSKRNDYKPLTAEVEQQVDAYLTRVYADVNADVDAVERAARERAAERLNKPVEAKSPHAQPAGAKAGGFSVGMGGSYFAWALVTALIVAAIGAGIGYVAAPTLEAEGVWQIPEWPATPENGAIAGAGVGAVIGFLLGLIFRSFNADGARKKKLHEKIRQEVHRLLLEEGRKGLKEDLAGRRGVMRDELRATFTEANREVERQLESLREEEDSLQREREESINRLQPKIDQLSGLGRKAREVLELSAPKGATA